MPSRLSVCLLTRDDERQIERAIRSVLAIADEVIVADTGSTDRTIERAREAGARVVEVGWDDDFAAGRNAAIAEAEGDWVLWLNPDEAWVEPGPTPTRAVLALLGDHVGALARIQDQARLDRPDLLGVTWDLRLFRNHLGLRYVGRVHPALDLDRVGSEGEAKAALTPSPIVIHRYAYSSTLDEGKVRWAIRLLEKELIDRPDRLATLIEYGRNLLLIGDRRGHRVLADAIDQIAPARDDPAAPGPDVATLLEYILRAPADAYQGSVGRDQATAMALRWFPDSPPLLWAIAEPAFRAGKLQAAAVLLDQLVHFGRTGNYNHALPFDPRIIGTLPLMNLGQCFRALGEPEKARKCFHDALSDLEFGPAAAEALTEMDDE